MEHGIEISKSSRECLEWISPDEIKFLEKVGTGGFGVFKEGIWERGKILFWDKKNQNFTIIKVDETTLTWGMFLDILFQIAGVVIYDLGLCRSAYSPQPGEIFCVIRYLATEICNLSPHTKQRYL
ncbi:hypothetical protein G9A89_012899 [Geosiphon pyriformis]|nr:hypothetical protein G9A89_012899 [Geosiphon pyriformis]